MFVVRRKSMLNASYRLICRIISYADCSVERCEINYAQFCVFNVFPAYVNLAVLSSAEH